MLNVYVCFSVIQSITTIVLVSSSIGHDYTIYILNGDWYWSEACQKVFYKTMTTLKIHFDD